MTLANQITIARLLLVPVFAVFAARYGLGVEAGQPRETLRWAALGVFVLASATDGLDGWIARRFNQKSRLGAILDPLADKTGKMTHDHARNSHVAFHRLRAAFLRSHNSPGTGPPQFEPLRSQTEFAPPERRMPRPAAHQASNVTKTIISPLFPRVHRHLRPS